MPFTCKLSVSSIRSVIYSLPFSLARQYQLKLTGRKGLRYAVRVDRLGRTSGLPVGRLGGHVERGHRRRW